MSGFKKSKGGNYNRPNMAKDGSGDDSRSRAELGADPSVDGTYRAYFAGKIGKVDKQRGPVSQFSNNDDYNTKLNRYRLIISKLKSQITMLDEVDSV